MIDALLGTHFSHYRLVSRLGAGGMGIVYLAEDARLGRRVAVKLLSETAVTNPQALARFDQEARAASALNHPNICVIHDIGLEHGRAFIVMEHLEGETLRARLDRQLPSVDEALEIASQMADALEAAHQKKLIHRDIKPANIFVLPGNHVKLLDFGLAKRMDVDTGSEETRAVQELTESGTTVGTVAYMSTEQVRGEALDQRSDIWSFGLVLYEMLTGARAFKAPSTALVFDAILHSTPPPPSAFNPAIPAVLDQVVAKALEKLPARRYQSMAEVRADLKRAREPGSSRSGVAARSGSTATRAARRRKADSDKVNAIQSVAVLPFVNSGNDPDAEYLSDGITEGIINRLSRLRGLRVTSRSTVFRYKNSTADLMAIASELKVRAMVLGRLDQRDQRLVVKVELVDVRRQAQLWGEQYSRPQADIFDLQEGIAVEVARSLEVALSRDDQKQLVKRHTEDGTAYRAYLRGRFCWNKRTVQGFLQAIDHFQEAIELDPGYALAYTGLADTYNLLGYYNTQRPTQAYPRAKAASGRALEIDPSMAEAHGSLGYTRLFFDRDWSAAEDSFKEAIRLHPTYASAHQWYGWYFIATGQPDEALAAMQRAHAIDPLSLIINDHLGYCLALAGQTDAAAQQLNATLELDPNFAITRLRLGSVYLGLGRIDEAIREMETAVQLTDGRMALGYLGQAFGIAGDRTRAAAVLADLRARSADRFVSPLDVALVHAGLGDVDAVFASLADADAERVSDLIRMRVLPWPDAVTSDPRFATLLRTLGLERR
jgi:serine/threonine protein kinase/tetratricopeptide (TPR) repeat protein